MHWLALLLPHSPPPITDADAARAEAHAEAHRQALAWWALQFTPRVARLEEAVLLEGAASLRLFGGAAALHKRIWRGAKQAGLSLSGIAWAPTSLGALALARSGVSDGLGPALTPLLDGLPLHALSAVQAHAPMLARLGCKRLADVRRLPRAALAKRFDTALLRALDEAYGDAPEVHQWLQAPAQFQARLELPERVEHAMVLLHHVRHLLLQLCAWLAARHAGIQHLVLHWQFDGMRARDVGSSGALSLHTAEATRDFGHLSRLLAEHLARLTLAAPVGEISLQADDVIPLNELSASLLPQSPDQAVEPLAQLLERMAVRLGPTQVRVGCLQEDHRPEMMQRWQAWPGTSTSKPARSPGYPQPSWLLDPPLRLGQSRHDQPEYQGPLQLIAGPQRIEGGWWQAAGVDGVESRHVQRDYFLYRSARAGLLWVFQQRLSAAEHGWYLHGVFA